METINSKTTVKYRIQETLAVFAEEGQEAFINRLHDSLLQQKIRFPLLEYAAKEMFLGLPEKKHISICDSMIKRQAMGSQVLAGIILQLRLPGHFAESIGKAGDYIRYGNQWYVCDIIGERVLGYAMLCQPEKTLPVLVQWAAHPDKWMVRTVGIATHYAIKKGLPATYAEPVFRILLSLADVTEFHTKKGIGWGAKTLARFHPDIIARYEAELSSENTRRWFRTKVRIGLQRGNHKAAAGNVKAS